MKSFGSIFRFTFQLAIVVASALISVVLIVFVLLGGLKEIPPNTNATTIRIPVGYGPEDMVLDKTHGPQRFLVSCAGRREDVLSYNNIYSYTIGDMEGEIIPRFNEPDTLAFRPHGIYLQGDSLYVISHDETKNLHYIYTYLVENSKLTYFGAIYSPLLTSPNAIVVNERGEIFISNDRVDHKDNVEFLLKPQRAKLLKYDRKNWSIISDHVAIGNGLAIRHDTLWQATSGGQGLCCFDLQHLPDEHQILDFYGLDNLRWHNDRLIVTAHLVDFDLMMHSISSEFQSATVVYEVDPLTGHGETIYVDHGSNISAGSTAIRIEDDLYISQVFEPYLLKVSLPHQE